MKKLVKSLPFLGPSASKLAQLPIVARARRLAFRDSANYWEARYRSGGTSGAGSYGRLAAFKAEILNGFVQDNHLDTVIEFGCGDGAQLELANYPEYVGVDVALSSIKTCAALFAHDPTKRFFSTNDLPPDIGLFDLALSLDVIYHLVEDSVFDSYMKLLFTHSQRHVVIYASNYDAPTDHAHVRHRKFTNWIAANASEWRAAGYVANRFPFDLSRPRDTSFADFHFYVRQSS